MIVRHATYADVPAMVSLLAALFSIESDFAVDADQQARGISQLLAASSNRCCVMVAESDGDVVGMVTGQLVVSTAEGGLSAIVEDLIIAQGRRGQGFGQRLLNAIIAWATALGACRLQLLADATNKPAMAFYRHQGWATTQLVCLRRRP